MLYFVRHGETEANRTKVSNGRTDYPLNETGILQAQAVALQLKDISFSAMYTSSLSRAKKTCELINQYHNNQIVTEPRLVERDYGCFENTVSDEQTRCNIWNTHLNLEVKNGERVKDLMQRVCAFLTELEAKHNPTENILLVAHGGVGRCVECYFNGIPSDGKLLHLRPNNATAKVYDFNKKTNQPS